MREYGVEERERGRRVRVRQELAERVERVVPLVRLLVQEGDPASFGRVRKGGGEGGQGERAYRSGARRASVAVCGSLSERARRANGVCVSPARGARALGRGAGEGAAGLA